MDTIVYKAVLYGIGITTVGKTQSNQSRTLALMKANPKCRSTGKGPNIPIPESFSYSATEGQSKSISGVRSDRSSTHWKFLLCKMQPMINQLQRIFMKKGR